MFLFKIFSYSELKSLIVCIFLLLIIGCNSAMSNSVTKFEWDATESAPKLYPMEIIKGNFIYKDEAELGLYIPSGGTLIDGWGNPVSSHVTGEKFKALPDRLIITFFSYAEKQFYHGEFKLPYERILALFKEGVALNSEYPVYSSIMAGIAPGGMVSVWVLGSGDYKEVFFGQAGKIDLEPGAAFALPFKDKAQSDEYVDEGLSEVLEPEELASLKKNGIPFGLWARYRNHYEWEPVLTKGFQLNSVSYEFLNGERYKKPGMLSRPVPKELRFKTVINDKRRIFIVKFDEFEIMDAFEKLGVNNQKVYMEFEPRLPRDQTKVHLYNDKESIELKKYKSKK